MRFPCKTLTASLCLLFSYSSQASAPPNILFIAVDDLNDWISPLDGHSQTITPNFDRLAERGVTFLDAHCNIPICSPSRTSFMTGLYPEKTGVFTNGNSFFDVDPSIQSIPQHLSQNGYQTFSTGKVFPGSDRRYASYVDKLGPDSGNQGGPFTREEINTLNQNPTHRVDRGPGKLKATLPLNGMPDDRRRGVAINNSFDWGPVDVTETEMADGMVARWAADQLTQTHEKPFYLGVGFYRPHQPLFAPRKYFEPFNPEKMQLPQTLPHDLDDLPLYAQKLARFALTSGTHKTVVEYGQWGNAVAAYLACVNFIDDQIGLILDALDNSVAADNTWIILVSDHGWHLGQKEHWGKFTPWAVSTRVPVILVPPSSYNSKSWVRGGKVDTPISLLDIYPTIVELTGSGATGHSLDGQSLVPLLKPNFNPLTSDRFAVSSIGRGTHSVVKGRYRYIRYFDGSEELYDRQADPNEFQNLARKPQFADLKQQYKRHIPDDPDVEHFIRYEWTKIIVFKEQSRKPVLFEITPGSGIGGGIGETKDLSEKYSQLLTKIKTHLDNNPNLAKHLTLTETDLISLQ